MKSAPRRGMLGGAFDPPHLAHLAMAEAALGQACLSYLHVFPTGQAWHKARDLSPADDRLAMARLAFDSLPCVEVDDREIRRSGPTFTVDTLEALVVAYPESEWALFIGADQADAFTRWKHWERILQLATVFVAGREGTIEQSGIFDVIRSLQDRASQSGLSANRIQALSMPAMDISATDIRQRVACGLGISHLVPEAVAGYIAQHHLYQTA